MYTYECIDNRCCFDKNGKKTCQTNPKCLTTRKGRSQFIINSVEIGMVNINIFVIVLMIVRVKLLLEVECTK